MKKLKLKKRAVIFAGVFVLAAVDLAYLSINMISGTMLSAFGCVTLVIDILVLYTTSELLKK